MQTANQIIEALIEILKLLGEKLVDLLSALCQDVQVVIGDAASLHQHVGKICDLLLHQLVYKAIKCE